MILTHHALQRMRQRGIREAVLQTVLDYGREHRDSHGGRVVWLDRQARRFLRGELGCNLGELEKHLRAYAVVADDDAVITVGHRNRRIRH